MNKPPDETLKQGGNWSWLLVKNVTDRQLVKMRNELAT
jgi:hypothetical protein